MYTLCLNPSLLILCGRSIPKSKPPGKCVPGWNDHVRKYRDASIFWHTVWKQCGSPAAGVVAQVKRRASAEYKRARKRVERDRQVIIAQKMADSLTVIAHVICGVRRKS